MAIPDTISLLWSGAALVIGAAVGAFFYGGLWWTVSRRLASGQPGLWFLGSFVARTVVTALVILLVAHGRPDRFALCMLGFLAARAIILRRLRPSEVEHEGPEHAH